jgi:hypothetical protein
MINHFILILIHISPTFFLIMIIIMRGENFVAHLDGLGGTPVCRGTPVVHHWCKVVLPDRLLQQINVTAERNWMKVKVPLFEQQTYRSFMIILRRSFLN